MTQFSVKPDLQSGGGHALLTVPSAAKAASDPRFSISRGEGEKPNLGPAGWQAATALLQPLDATVSGQDLILHLGPSVVDTLEHGMVLLSLPAADIVEVPVPWPSHIPTSAENPPPEPTVVVPPSPPPPPPPAPSPQEAPPLQPFPPPAHPTPSSSQSKARSGSWLWLAVIALLLLVMAGGGAWYYLHPRHPAVVARNSPPPAKAPAASASPACGSGPVAQVLQCAKDAHQLYAIGRGRWKTDPNVGFLLLQTAVDRGSAEAAYFLAQRYDPVNFHPGGAIPKPEPREAARDYRVAAKADVPGASEHRAALKAWLEQRVKAGDVMAPLTLHDYWGKP